ncbi:MAG TPA: hypothetical protein VIK32_12600, partial [Candidatus Limnocylindrales bacterium]
SGGALGKRHATILQSDLPLQFLAASCDSYVGRYQKTDTLTQLEGAPYPAACNHRPTRSPRAISGSAC